MAGQAVLGRLEQSLAAWQEDWALRTALGANRCPESLEPLLLERNRGNVYRFHRGLRLQDAMEVKLFRLIIIQMNYQPVHLSE